ncbi:hypothetical protein [Paenibacillus elgii]|uniref:hypothetical protein n=1 Tax=Paenibacillus elgii TaxID=189691 RepID=UPI0013D143DA|nr:hypothetical protein [Paenibacillus elgii]
MPNHDFNRPCDCRECSRDSKQIVCPACNTCHVVIIDRIPEWSTDRKGFTGVEFRTPEEPNQTLICPDCGHTIKGTGYYTAYDAQETKRIREYLAKKAAAAKCRICGKIEGIDRAEGFFEEIRLAEKDGLTLCQSCLADRVQMETPDPSDATRKFIFDRRALYWKLDKIKVPCAKCGKQRWLNATNQWKSLCLPCYRMG